MCRASSGWARACEYLLERGRRQRCTSGTLGSLHEQLRRPTRRRFEGVRLYGPRTAGEGVAVVSLTFEGMIRRRWPRARRAYRVQVRAGLHCAPLMHRALGTLAGGGTVRFSLGPFNTDDQIEPPSRHFGEIAAAAA